MIPLKPDAAPADVTDFRPHLWLKACLSVELTSGPGGDWSRTVGKMLLRGRFSLRKRDLV